MRLVVLSLLVAGLATSVFVVACTSDDPASPSVEPDAATEPDGAPTTTDDAGGSTDAKSDAPTQDPLPSVESTLEVKAAGASPTTAAIGPVTLAGGYAQWRPAPFGGGYLAVTLVEGAPSARTFELAIQDDDDALSADESFNGLAASGLPVPSGVRVETFGASATWQTDGDGTVKVKAFSPTSVTLEFNQLAQFVRAPGSNDTFVLSGTVTVAIKDLAPTSGPQATLTVSDPQNEGGGAALNVSSQAAIAAVPALGEEHFPYVGNRRAIRLAESAGGRRVLVSFPNGHLPHQGDSLSLTKFDRITIALVDGTTFDGGAGEKIWEADQGTVVVQSRTATATTLSVQGARMQSESPDAKGFFKLTGDVTVSLP